MFLLDLLYDLVTNYVLVCAACSWFVAQMIKVLTGIFKAKDFSVIELFFGTGGMPSSHTASVCALACAVAIKEGLGSISFAMCVVLALIVMRDATGMRRQVGEQAKALNIILQEIVEAKDPEITQKALNELAGHTPVQVAAGAAVGVVIPFLIRLIPVFS